jgi:hypothetical protein
VTRILYIFILTAFAFISFGAVHKAYAQTTCQGTYTCRLETTVCSSGCPGFTICPNTGQCPDGGRGSPAPGTCCTRLINEMVQDCSGLLVTGGSCSTTSVPNCLNGGYVSSMNCRAPTPTPAPDPCRGGPRTYCGGGASPYFCCGTNMYCTPPNPTDTNFICSTSPPPPAPTLVCVPGAFMGGTYCTSQTTCYDVWCNSAGTGTVNTYYTGAPCARCAAAPTPAPPPPAAPPQAPTPTPDPWAHLYPTPALGFDPLCPNRVCDQFETCQPGVANLFYCPQDCGICNPAPIAPTPTPPPWWWFWQPPPPNIFVVLERPFLGRVGSTVLC